MPLHFFQNWAKKMVGKANKTKGKNLRILWLGYLIIQIARSFTAIDLRPKRMHYLNQLGYTQHKPSRIFTILIQLGNFNKTIFFIYSVFFVKYTLSIGRGKSVWLYGRSDSVHTQKFDAFFSLNILTLNISVFYIRLFSYFTATARYLVRYFENYCCWLSPLIVLLLS